MLWYRLGVIIGFVSSLNGCMGEATTSAVCVADEWTFNQVGMSPCLGTASELFTWRATDWTTVAANLEAVCNGGEWNIPALPLGSDYSGPTDHQATECTCSTVVYSLVAACSICQQREYTTWNGWRENCSDHDVSISLYPLTIPAGITVPAWAYLNVTADDTFDPEAALSVSNAKIPDVASGNSSSAPSPVATISNSTNAHLGAIIGGVVGGVVLVIIIACASYYFYIRQKEREYYSEKARYDIAPSPAPLNPAFAALMTGPMHELKLYDPTDPTTFPTSPAPSLPTYKSSDGNGSTLPPEPVPPLPGHYGQYTGAPEV